MKLGGRNLVTILKAPFFSCHWRAAANMLRVYRKPLDGYFRYLLGGGNYPAAISLNSRVGKIEITAYSRHDVLTINEIFCRGDYPVPADARVVVDFGSNIGISALFFLTAAPEAFVYCYEPLPWNCDRLRKTLSGYEDRYELNQCAVGNQDGDVTFIFEPSGRYGRISDDEGEKTTVPCRIAAKEIDRILAKHGKIDVLKVDIEGLEEDVIRSLSPEQLALIDNIYVEAPLKGNILSRPYKFRMYAGVGQFKSA